MQLGSDNLSFLNLLGDLLQVVVISERILSVLYLLLSAYDDILIGFVFFLGLGTHVYFVAFAVK